VRVSSPALQVVEDGDLINVDVTVYYNGYHGDCSETFCVGNVGLLVTCVSGALCESSWTMPDVLWVGQVDEAGRQLVRVTYEAW
jgi:methionine aminopeptidase